jgi:predicted metal-dependent hydrolase
LNPKKTTKEGQHLLSDQLSKDELDDLYSGIGQFNEQKFFECHETLEKIWLRQEGETKELLQGLIQLAVGYHHMLNGNAKGALKLLARGLERVAKYKPSALGLELSDLCQAVQSTLNDLTSKKPPIHASSIPRVRIL